jgi:hypothetical protein
MVVGFWEYRDLFTLICPVVFQDVNVTITMDREL